MSALLPQATSVNDLCIQALKACGYLGPGNTATSEDIQDAWIWLQWLLQTWQHKRWLVYHLVTWTVTSTGQTTPYTVGPGGQIDTGASQERPDGIESAFLRQITQPPPNQIDYPLGLYQSMEDYSAIALKLLASFPQIAFYDPAFPLGNLYTYPVAQASVYAIGIVLKYQLPASFPSLATNFVLPYEYFNAIVNNLGMRLRAKYRIPTFPGDPLPGMAKDGLAVLRGINTAVKRLGMPSDLQRPGIYNIFSDRSY